MNDKAAAEKAAAEKAAAAKAAAEKAAKAAADKPKPKDKLPQEDPTGATPSKGWLQLTTKPIARVFVDGNDTGLSTPITGRVLALPAGKHRITFQTSSGKFTFPVTVKAGETVTLDKALQQ